MKRAALLLFGAVLTGCTPAGLWGNAAAYAPSARGYVFERADGSGNQALLVSPVTGKKFRCREDLEPMLDTIVASAKSRVDDTNAAIGTAIPSSIVFFPLNAPATIFMLGSAVGRLGSDGLYAAGASEFPDALYGHGRRAFAEGRWNDSARLFELAISRTPRSSFEIPSQELQRAPLWLGFAYEKAGRPRGAARAYRRFIEFGRIEDAKAYDLAEAHLEPLEPEAFPPCRSRAPFPIDWSAPTR